MHSQNFAYEKTERKETTNASPGNIFKHEKHPTKNILCESKHMFSTLVRGISVSKEKKSEIRFRSAAITHQTNSSIKRSIM